MKKRAVQYILQVIVLCDVAICFRPGQWFLMVIARGYVFYQFSVYQALIEYYFSPVQEMTLWGVVNNIFIVLPLCLFILWYFFTTLLLVLTAMFSCFDRNVFWFWLAVFAVYARAFRL